MTTEHDEHDDLEHADGRGEPQRDANPEQPVVAVYDTDGSHYDDAVYAEDGDLAAQPAEREPGFKTDDPASRCDDPDSVLAE